MTAGEGGTGGPGVEKMGGMPKAGTVPSDNPMHRSPSEGCVQGEAMASISKLLPFSRTFKAALFRISAPGTWQQTSKLEEVSLSCWYKMEDRTPSFRSTFPSKTWGSQEKKCVCRAPPLRTN